jgi:hypothetical protein
MAFPIRESFLTSLLLLPASASVIATTDSAEPLTFRTLAANVNPPGAAAPPFTIAGHRARFAADGSLAPWASWTETLEREMEWYQRCPSDGPYPRFITLTFMDGAYHPSSARKDFIPAMQDGMGILSYLKYYRFTGRTHPEYLRTARAMGDFLINEALTPGEGRYPEFPRSTGVRGVLPLPPDCGSQDDHPFEIQPDKGGIVGYALMELAAETHHQAYAAAARRIAQVLAANMRAGDAEHSPWPFRADFRTGEPRGPVSGNMTYILRLFDRLLAGGETEFAAPRARLWAWIRDRQLPDAAGSGRLWAQFFEDHHNPGNRTAWAPLALCAYLLEERERLSPDWRAQARSLIEFVNRNFVRVHFGVPACGEQDEDLEPWGGINTTWGAVLARYSAATGSSVYRRMGQQALTLSLYAVDEDGSPRDSPLSKERGGWQEDAHTDTVHNIVDTLEVCPDWGGP